MRIAVGLLIFLFVGSSGHASRAIDIGHNLTPTTNGMPVGHWTVGNYAVAYAVTDSLFVATSPWVWLNYNTRNIHLKWVTSPEENIRFGVFASYFESLPWPFFGEAPYFWRSSSLQFLGSVRWSSKFETFFSFRSSYYWNDDRPYSIRMDSGDDAIRGQIDVTSLTRFAIEETGFGIGLEFGTVGANYLYPYLHIGASISYVGGPWLLQGGFSYTMQWRELHDSKGMRPGRVDTRIRQSPYDGQIYYYPYETALHPEMQVQYFF